MNNNGTQKDWATFKIWIQECQKSTDIAKYICLGSEMRFTYSLLVDYLTKYLDCEEYEIVHTKDLRCNNKHLCLVLDHDLVSYEGLVIRFYRGNQLLFTPHFDYPLEILANLLIPPITLAGIVQHYRNNLVIPSEFMLQFYRLSSVLYPHAFQLLSLQLNPLPTL
jgi:hypothetical protein